jgi:ZIP family zinc transporter
MVTALLFGAASLALVLGGVAGAFWKPPGQLVATGLAFASGSLAAALAFDLVGEAFRTAGLWPAGLGFLGGAAVFVTIDAPLERFTAKAGGGALGFALLAAVTLDGVPENIALGISLLEDAGANALALLVAIFASNLPESLGGAADMREQGRSKGFVIATWTGTGVILAAAVVRGNTALAGVGQAPLALMLSFAGGAVLASLAATLMPDAYEQGGPLVAFATCAGFFLSFALSET